MKRYFQLYDVANDYSLSPIEGKYQFGDLKHAKEQAQKITFKWYDEMHRKGKSHFPKSDYKIKWRRTSAAGTRPEALMEWNGFIHGDELSYKIIERKKNPCNYKTLLKNPRGKFTAKMIAELRKGYGTIEKIDPGMPTYTALTTMLDTMTQPQLKQLAAAKIKFVSKLAANRITRKGNPNMAKKKRSAKQLANDRRLGRMAKARAKKKRGKKHPGKRAGVPGLRKMMRTNPKRRALKKSHLWLVFKCGRSLQYFFVSAAPNNWTSKRGSAILFKTKDQALKIARSMARKPGYKRFQIGVSPDNITGAKILADCKQQMFLSGKA